jgi:hypothetical protein
MSNRLTEMFEQERAEKFKMTGLQYETVNTPKEALPTSLDAAPVQPNVHEINRLLYLKERFGIKGNSLEFEGHLGSRLEQSQTLENASIDAEKQRMQWLKLKTATASFQGKPLRLWYEVSKA